jgi:hypothetical protein
MVLFLEITNIWQKSRDFWFLDFFIEIIKFLWIFVCFECVSSIFFEVIANLLKMLFYQRQPSEAFLYHRMVSGAPKKSIGLALWI